MFCWRAVQVRACTDSENIRLEAPGLSSLNRTIQLLHFLIRVPDFIRRF